MASDLLSIALLGNRISSHAGLLASTLQAKGLKQPSFHQDADEEFPSPTDEDAGFEEARVALLEDTKRLHDLILGPAEAVRGICWSSIDISIQRIIYHYKLFSLIPLGEEGLTYTDLAHKTGLSEQRLKSVIRQSALNRIFEELPPAAEGGARVRHTAASALLLRNKSMQDWFGHCVEEMAPAVWKLAEAWNHHPTTAQTVQDGEDRGEVKEEGREEITAFQLAFNTPDTLFQFYEKHPDRQARFFGTMAGVGRDKGHSLEHVVKGYDWAELGKATVVDVGGSSGFLSRALATAYPELSFIVQDYEHTITQGRNQLPSILSGRIKFQAHDFFDSQPAAADVYLLRHICHNWSREKAVKILRNLVPAMKKKEGNYSKSRILLVEVVVIPPRNVSGDGMNELEERYMRNVDITMLSMLNTQERSAEDWADVVAQTDPQLEIKSIRQPRGSWDSIIEIGFKKEHSNATATSTATATADANVQAPEEGKGQDSSDILVLV